MKFKSLLYCLILSLLIISCSGSDVYRGEWNAINNSGEQLEIIFGEKDLTIIEADTTKYYSYTQNSYNFENSVKTYGIKLDDARYFQVHFPIAKDNSRAVILDANEQPVYFIGRDEIPSYDNFYGL